MAPGDSIKVEKMRKMPLVLRKRKLLGLSSYDNYLVASLANCPIDFEDAHHMLSVENKYVIERVDKGSSLLSPSHLYSAINIITHSPYPKNLSWWLEETYLHDIIRAGTILF